ncbi:MAG TPA: ABC transporter substrate-binding protein [Acidimicrobiales bacterium]|nr:ABC transporter substrate-binding protein [Acidimicrobiales bacterium]
MVALLVLLGVAAAGGQSPPPHLVASSVQVPDDSPAATSSGIPAENLQAGATADGATGPAAGATAARGATTAGPAGTRSTMVGAAPRTYPDPGVTDNEIRVGGSTFTSGPAAVYGEQIAVGFAAGVNYINEHGGINGRKVVLKIYDDGGDPAKQLANVKRLVEVDKVFALAMAYAPQTGQYVAQQGIPVFHLGQFNEEFTNPWWFPVGGPQRLSSYTSAWWVNHLGAKSVAIFYLDAGAVNYSRQYAESVAKDYEAYGIKVPVLSGFAVDQTSCSDAISAARNANVDYIVFEIDASKTINCGVEAQIQGYKPPKGWGGYLIGVPVIHEALGDESIGMYAFDAFGANYQVQDYIDAVRKVSSKTESYSSVTASYFISALLMRDSIAKLGDDISRVKLRDTLNTFTNWTPGLTTDPNQPSWTWRPSCHAALKGGYVIQVQKQPDGSLKWVQVTPQFIASPLPPGASPPADYAGCDIFTTGSPLP